MGGASSGPVRRIHADVSSEPATSMRAFRSIRAALPMIAGVYEEDGQLRSFGCESLTAADLVAEAAQRSWAGLAARYPAIQPRAWVSIRAWRCFEAMVDVYSNDREPASLAVRRLESLAVVLDDLIASAPSPDGLSEAEPSEGAAPTRIGGPPRKIRTLGVAGPASD